MTGATIRYSLVRDAITEQRVSRRASASSGGNMTSLVRSTVTLHVVSSLGGFIAKKDNSVSWMDSSGDVYERGVTDDGAEVIRSIDCYVLGSRTYEHALQLGWPYGDTPTVVITNRELPSRSGI